MELLPFYLASFFFEESPESYLSLSRGLFEGTLVIGLILRSLWGLYKIHETLWFYLVTL